MARRKVRVSFFILILFLTGSALAIDRVPEDTTRTLVYVEPPVPEEFDPYCRITVGTIFRLDERDYIEKQLSLAVKFWYYVQKHNAIKFGASYTPSSKFTVPEGILSEKVKIFSLETGIRPFLN